MSNPSWPATLPQYFDRDGFEIVEPETIDRTNMDSGPDKQRLKARGGATPVTGTLFCRTDQQRDDLREFYRAVLHNGALEFDWVHPETQAPCTMRFIEKIRWSRFGQRSLAHCKVEILP